MFNILPVIGLAILWMYHQHSSRLWSSQTLLFPSSVEMRLMVLQTRSTSRMKTYRSKASTQISMFVISTFLSRHFSIVSFDILRLVQVNRNENMWLACRFLSISCCWADRSQLSQAVCFINLLKPTGHVMHQLFNIQQLYVLPTLCLCVLYLSENKQRLVPLTA